MKGVEMNGEVLKFVLETAGGNLFSREEWVLCKHNCKVKVERVDNSSFNLVDIFDHYTVTPEDPNSSAMIAVKLYYGDAQQESKGICVFLYCPGRKKWEEYCC